MADVANCMNSPCKANFGQILSEAADGILSPEVREAMDRIFPQSSSQFLQGGLSFEEDPFLSIASSGVDRDQQHAKPPFASPGSPGVATLASMGEAKATNEPTVAVSGGAVKSFFEPYSLAVTSVPSVVTTGCTVTEADTCQTREPTAESASEETKLQKSMTSKTRISRADFEILTSYDAVVSSCERTPRKQSNTDLVSDNDNSGDGSDSEDMSRPFASITKEKKKKRKKVLTEPYKHQPQPSKSVSYLSEHNVNSGDEFKISNSWNSYTNSAVNTGSGERVVNCENDFTTEVNTQNELLLTRDLGDKSTQSCNQKNYNSGSNGYNIDICPVKDVYKDSVTTNEDISNTSNSSVKENVLRNKQFPRQKLPKVKRDHFHIVRHVNKIKNTFPPCCVVLRKIHTHLVHNVRNVNVTDNVLSLAARVRCLNRLCDKGYLICKKNRKAQLAEKLGYVNFFEEAILPGASDDEFEKPKMRSLRKRAKKVNYLEPCEDDIVEEFSSKRSPVKCKDGSLVKLRKESTEKQQVSHLSEARHETESSENNKRYENAQYIENNKPGICSQEQYVHPSSNINSASMYNPNSAEVSQHMYSHLKKQNSSAVPFLSYLSGLSGGASADMFPPYVPSFLPSLPMSISGSLPTYSYIEQAPFSYQVSSMRQDPQQLNYTKMNGKDVYMQLLSSTGVASGGLGASAPGLPTGKTLGVPPGPSMFSHPLPQGMSVPSNSQAMFRPPVPVVSVTNGNMMSQASAQMSSFYNMLNRPVHTSSYNIPVTSLTFTSCSHGPSHMNMAIVKPIPHTSYAAPSSSCLSAPVTAASTRTSTFMTSTSSSAQGLSVPFVPMSVSYISPVQNSSASTINPHLRVPSTQDFQPRLPTTPSSGPERYANLLNLTSQSHFPNMLNHIAERLTSIPSPVSQSRIPNLPSPVSQSRTNIPNPMSQSRVPNLLGPISQSRIPNLLSPVSQSRIPNLTNPISQLISNLQNPISQSRIPNLPSPVSQSRSNIPSPISQSRIPNLPNSVSQSRSDMPSPISQSRIPNLPNPISQPRSDMPSPISQSRIPNLPSPVSQSRSNIPSPISQSRIPNLPNSVSQSRSDIPSPVSQSRIPNLPSPISQSRIPNLSSPISQSRSNIPSPVSQSRPSNIPSPVLPPRAHSISSQSSQPTANHISPYVTNFPSSNFQPRLPTQPASLVPGYSATGTLRGLATLSGSASLLTSELPANKVVLPQQKGYSDHKLDQHAIKRRKLEQKYPLPPGVIIKTERLDSPPEASSVNKTPQSLLSQNSQLLSTLMPRHCVQSEIMNPSAHNTISTQSIRSSSEVPNMAACLVGRHPGLSPSLWLTHASADVTSAEIALSFPRASSAGSVSSLVATTAATTRTINRFYPGSTSLNTTAAAGPQPYSMFPQVYPPTTQQSFTNHIAASTSDALNCITPASAATLVQPKAPANHLAVGTSDALNCITPVSVANLAQPKAPVITSFESSSSAPLDIAATLSPSQALPQSASPRTPAVTESMPSPSLQQNSSRLSPQAAALNSFSNSLKELEMFVQVQESCGLRNGRLDKLKELLYKKQQQYKELQRFVEASTTSESGNRRKDSEGNGTDTVLGERRRGSEAEPFVID